MRCLIVFLGGDGGWVWGSVGRTMFAGHVLVDVIVSRGMMSSGGVETGKCKSGEAVCEFSNAVTRFLSKLLKSMWSGDEIL